MTAQSTDKRLLAIAVVNGVGALLNGATWVAVGNFASLAVCLLAAATCLYFIKEARHVH